MTLELPRGATLAVRRVDLPGSPARFETRAGDDHDLAMLQGARLGPEIPVEVPLSE